MNSTEASSINRLLFATKGIISLLVVCCIMAFDLIDLRNLQSDSKILHILSQLDKTSDSYFNFNNFELARIEWLKDQSHFAYKPYSKSRKAIMRTLGIQVRMEDYTSRGGRQYQDQYDQKGGGSPEYNKLLIGESANNYIFMHKIGTASAVLEKREDVSDPMSSHTVDSLIARFKQLSKPDTIQVLVGIDSALLKETFDSLLNSTTKYDSTHKLEFHTSGDSNVGDWSHTLGSEKMVPNIYIRLEKIELVGQRLYFKISYNKPLPNLPRQVSVEKKPNPNEGQTDPNNGGTDPSERWTNPRSRVVPGAVAYKIGIPVTSEIIVMPSMFFINRFDNEIATLLANENNKLNRISRIYGFYPVETVEKSAWDKYLSRTSSISVFGFDFGRTSFLFVLMTLTLIFFLILYSEAKRLRKVTPGYYWSVTQQHVMGFLLEMKMIRFFCWVLAPFIFLIMVFNHLTIFPPALTYTIGTAMWLVIFILGLKSYLITSKVPK